MIAVRRGLMEAFPMHPASIALTLSSVRMFLDGLKLHLP
jgi:hypothetical protein